MCLLTETRALSAQGEKRALVGNLTMPVDLLDRSAAPIVLPSGSCADMIVHRYPDLLADDVVYAPKARHVADRTYELTQYLVDVLGVEDVGACGQGAVAYHPSCHLLRGIGVRDAPSLAARLREGRAARAASG